MGKAVARKFAKDEGKMRKFADEERDNMSSKPRKKKKNHSYKMGVSAGAGHRVKKVERKHKVYKKA